MVRCTPERHFRDARPRCQTASVTFDPKADLHEYLQSGREVMLWKLDRLSEYDIRRPLVPTGTNLLGLVQHAASIESGYFGPGFARPFPDRLPWPAGGRHRDLWARPAMAAAVALAVAGRVWAGGDLLCGAEPLLTVGEVPW